VEIHSVPGNHQTIVEAPHVKTLAEVLGGCIERAEANRLAGSPAR
jgi:thioesterase domain-containing protein